MTTAPEIWIIQVEHGSFAQARALNPCFPSDSPLLLAGLLVRWEPAEPVPSIARVEAALLALSPGFARHECRGLDAYHVFARERRRAPAIEAPLMLAHLIEHALIDFQCSVLGQRRCSGVTAARRDLPGRFDLLIECPDFPVGRCCLGLAVSWVSAAAAGQSLGSPERQILEAARLAYERRGEGVTPAGLARALRWPRERAERALSALNEVGFLVESRYTVNLSGIPEYRVGRA